MKGFWSIFRRTGTRTIYKNGKQFTKEHFKAKDKVFILARNFNGKATSYMRDKYCYNHGKSKAED